MRAAILAVMETDAGNAGNARECSPHAEEGAEVIRLHPLSVLVVSSDHRFRAVMEMLVARRGCSAHSSSATQAVAQTVGERRIDVLIVDGVAALYEVAREIAEGDASLPPVGVVLVSERGEPVPAGLRSLAKWGDFEQLFAAIVEADRARTPRADAARASRPGGIRAVERG